MMYIYFSCNILSVSKYNCTYPKYVYVLNCNAIHCTNGMILSCDMDFINREEFRR